jgi:hypothetical protein
MRKNFNTALDYFDTIGDLLDRNGKAVRNNPKYRQLQDLIYWNLLDQNGQEFVLNYMNKKHGNYENVALSFKEIFDAMKFKKAINVDPEEDFFSGLLDDEEYEKYGSMKENGITAKQFYELLCERNDRESRKNRAILAQLFREFSKDGKPNDNKARSLKFKK